MSRVYDNFRHSRSRRKPLHVSLLLAALKQTLDKDKRKQRKPKENKAETSIENAMEEHNVCKTENFEISVEVADISHLQCVIIRILSSRNCCRLSSFVDLLEREGLEITQISTVNTRNNAVFYSLISEGAIKPGRNDALALQRKLCAIAASDLQRLSTSVPT